VENKLKLLYALQQVDLQLQDIHELKGDLPGIVDELGTKVNDIEQKVKELEKTIKQSKMDRDRADTDIIDLTERVEKYKSQQLQVKSNKQYDALTKEIELAEEKSSKLQKEMEVLEGRIQVAKTDSTTLSAQLDELKSEYDERKKELKEVNKEHEKEELKFNHEREKLLARIEKDDLERYNRIYKAKNGKAVVLVKRGACGGCFNRVPPQKILEIKQNAKLFVCEHCGRILVSDQIAEKSLVL
jgi:predicted  nucleic acid-binding Zn-ribbon protein